MPLNAEAVAIKGASGPGNGVRGPLLPLLQSTTPKWMCDACVNILRRRPHNLASLDTLRA